MGDSRSVFIYSPELEKFSYPAACPFNTSRAGRTRSILQSLSLLTGGNKFELPPVRATRDELEQFHTAKYLDALEKAGRGELDPRAGVAFGLATPDCPIFQGLYDYASLAAGGTISGARQIIAGEYSIVFNPSGGFHHAHPGKAEGFCYLNDLVLAIQALTAAGKRVVFLDLDVHHCDGVQKAFYSRSDVMTISMHESGRTLFPGSGFESETGSGRGAGYSVNIPLPAGTYDELYVQAFMQVVFPLMKAYDPDVVVLELGMDALYGDPLAHMRLTNNVFAEIVPSVLGMDRPVLATGGGGYNVENTARGWALCWNILTGNDTIHDWAFGMSGAMLGNTNWSGGLRDRVLVQDPDGSAAVDAEAAAVIERVRRSLFPVHGIPL